MDASEAAVGLPTAFPRMRPSAATTSTAVSTLTLSNSTTFPIPIGKIVIINNGPEPTSIGASLVDTPKMVRCHPKT